MISRSTNGRFRTGIVALAMHSRIAPDLFLRHSQALAVAGGADSLWVGDHLVNLVPSSIWTPSHTPATRFAPRADALYEPWTTLGYLAARNKLTRTRIGVGVTDAGRRNPAVTAQAAATLHLLTRGRAILGIGPGERQGNEPYGVDWTRPVARFEEAIATIRALWDSEGRPVNRDSEFFPLRAAVFDVPPHRGTRPELWIGAHGPRMLRATGRFADAWYPGFPQRPEDYGQRLGAVRAAAADFGRDPMSITPAANLTLLTANTRADVDELLGTVAVRSLGLLAGADVWARHGAEHPLGPRFTGLQDLLPQALDESAALEFASRVPESLLRETLLAGTPAEVIDQVAHWRDNGLRHLALLDMSGLHPVRRKAAGAMVAAIRVLRGLRRL